MLQSTTRRPTRPATAADFHRLADVAHERGLRLFRDPSGHWLCTSASHEQLVHYVTALSCDCAGFMAHQRCSHNALLLDHLGWLPELEPAIDSEPCISCTNGRIEEWGAGHVIGCRPCPVCGGRGRLPVAPAVLPLAEPAVRVAA